MTRFIVFGFNRTMHCSRLHLRLGVLLLVASLGAGTARAGLKDILPGGDKPPKPKTPVRFTAVWTDTTLNTPGQHPVRGFGGRLMFYDTEDGEPVAVDGMLTVYAYRDGTNATAHNIPAKKFVFHAEDMGRHYSKSPLGHSYSFWLPWDPVGGPQEQLSLIARFEPRKGRPIASDITRRVLPGTVQQADNSTKPVDGARGAAPSPVSQTNHYQPVVNRSVAAQINRPKMSAETIELPPNASQRTNAVTPGAAFHETTNDNSSWPNPQAAYQPPRSTRQPLHQLPQQSGLPNMGQSPPQTIPSADSVPHAGAPVTEFNPATGPLNEAPPSLQPRGQQARFEPRTRRALGGSIRAPRSTHVIQRPHHAGWPNDPPTSPRWAQSPGWPKPDSPAQTIQR
jgi:hypothetical protein